MQVLTRRFLTVALLFVLALVAAACTEVSVGDIPEPTGVPQETARVSVFFATGRTVVEEPRIVDSTDLYGATFAVFLEARPELSPDVAIVQPEAQILDIEVVDGVMTIDWSSEVLAFEADDSEKSIALAAILLTAGQFPEVEKVRFTVEGQVSGQAGGRDVESFWGKISLKGQPFDVIRPPAAEEFQEETTSTAGSESDVGSESGQTTTTSQ
ncbi:MAG: GerMN domain-containing protein [Thermoleophilia bacterium]